jgi:surfactin synthase thioesterase subunit
VFIPGVGGRGWLFEHTIANLADTTTGPGMVLDRQATRAEIADYALAHAPQRFSIAGRWLGGWVAQEVAARARDRVPAAWKLQLAVACRSPVTHR